MYRFLSLALLVIAAGACSQGGPAPEAAGTPGYTGDRVGHYGFGTEATAQQIAGWDIDVRPDGVGLPERFQAGVGLTSMRERAAELGGRCEVTARPSGGTRVLAHLPLSRET